MHDKTSHHLPAARAVQGGRASEFKSDSDVPRKDRPAVYLFTDTNDSTPKWQKCPHEMERVDASLRDITLEAVTANGGFIHDWAGDGALAIFQGGDPLKCALDIQLAVQARNFDTVGGVSVRIGLYVAWDAAPSFDKPSVHRAARIRDSAWGGQIVLSSLADAYSLPPDAELIDLGLCRLKGFDEPMRLFGLVHPALQRTEFPPPPTVWTRSPSIPAPATPIYGRERELAHIVGDLAGPVRLLTIVAPGGNGKSRLAIEVATHVSETKAVYFVRAEGAADSQELVSALARTLRFPFHERTSREDQLIDYLRVQHALIVLDSAERLAGKCRFLDRVLSDCPRLRVLATSREPLSLDNETVFRLPGLSGSPPPGQSFQSAPACGLFIREARKIDPAYDVQDHEAAIFSSICEMLGGSPLALHLAAQWTHLLPLAGIRDKLRCGLTFLPELAGEQSRHALQGVFEGSWALLDAEQQTALARLSVFEAGFHTQAAEIVAGVNVAVLGILERKCLIERRGAWRFIMHPLIHEYARSKLAAAPGDLLHETRQRHAGHFLDMTRQCFLRARNAEQSLMLDRVEAELANVRAAWAYALETADISRIRDAAEPIFYTLVLRALFHDCAALFEAEVEDPALSAYFLAIRANCLMHQGDFHVAESLANRALDMSACEANTAAHCDQALANIAHARGDHTKARSHYQSALAERTRLADDMGSFYSAMSLALLEAQSDNVAAARIWVKKSFRLCQRLGHFGGLLVVHTCAGDIALREGLEGAALKSYRKALEVSENVRHPQLKAATLTKVGRICCDRGDIDQACATFEEACEIAGLVGDRRIVVNASLGLGRALRRKGELNRAKVELQGALALARSLGSHAQLASALAEYARLNLAMSEHAAAARIAGLLRLLKLETRIPECDALIAEFEGRLPLLEDDLDAALLELINEPLFGALPF